MLVATVASVMDYAAKVWMHARGENARSWLNRAQKIGALAITAAFRTVAAAVVEAEASIPPIRERHPQRDGRAMDQHPRTARDAPAGSIRKSG